MRDLLTRRSCRPASGSRRPVKLTGSKKGIQCENCSGIDDICQIQPPLSVHRDGSIDLSRCTRCKTTKKGCSLALRYRPSSRWYAFAKSDGTWIYEIRSHVRADLAQPRTVDDNIHVRAEPSVASVPNEPSISNTVATSLEEEVDPDSARVHTPSSASNETPDGQAYQSASQSAFNENALQRSQEDASLLIPGGEDGQESTIDLFPSNISLELSENTHSTPRLDGWLARTSIGAIGAETIGSHRRDQRLDEFHLSLQPDLSSSAGPSGTTEPHLDESSVFEQTVTNPWANLPKDEHAFPLQRHGTDGSVLTESSITDASASGAFDDYRSNSPVDPHDPVRRSPRKMFFVPADMEGIEWTPPELVSSLAPGWSSPGDVSGTHQHTSQPAATQHQVSSAESPVGETPPITHNDDTGVVLPSADGVSTSGSASSSSGPSAAGIPFAATFRRLPKVEYEILRPGMGFVAPGANAHVELASPDPNETMGSAWDSSEHSSTSRRYHLCDDSNAIANADSTLSLTSPAGTMAVSSFSQSETEPQGHTPSSPNNNGSRVLDGIRLVRSPTLAEGQYGVGPRPPISSLAPRPQFVPRERPSPLPEPRVVLSPRKHANAINTPGKQLRIRARPLPVQHAGASGQSVAHL